VIEKDDAVGGLSRTVAYGAYRFDLGGHRIITDSEQVLDLLKDLLGDDLLELQRRTKIVFRGRRLSQPLHMGDMIREIDALTLLRAAASFARSRAAGALSPAPERSFEQWVVRRFGRELYNIFFGPYTEKVWGMPPSQISSEWAAQRIQVPGLVEVALHALRRAGRRPPVLATRYHYPRLGIGQAFEALAARTRSAGGRIVLRSPVTRLVRRGRRITEVVAGAPGSSTRFQCDSVISSIPLPDLAAAIDPPPPRDVLGAASRLRFRSIAFLFLAVDRDRVMDEDALYVPEPRYLPFRIEQPKLWSPEMAPAGTTSLCVEISCNAGDETWRSGADELAQAVFEDLRALGLLRSASEVIEVHRLNAEHAYPVLDVEAGANRRVVVEWMRSLDNLELCGRQGTFRYLNQDGAMDTATAAADRALGRRDVDVMDVASADSHLWQVGRGRGFAAGGRRS